LHEADVVGVPRSAPQDAAGFFIEAENALGSFGVEDGCEIADEDAPVRDSRPGEAALNRRAPLDGEAGFWKCLDDAGFVQTPSLPLPRHSGQSSARSWKAESAARTRKSLRIVRVSPYCIEKEKPHRKVSQGPRDSHFDAVRPFVGSDPAAARLVFLSFHSWLESASYFFPSREVQTVNCNLRSAVSLKL
jgi:hypothetical protein